MSHQYQKALNGCEGGGPLFTVHSKIYQLVDSDLQCTDLDVLHVFFYVCFKCKLFVPYAVL